MKITEINAKNYTVYQPTELKKTDIKQIRNQSKRDKLAEGNSIRCPIYD